MSDHDADHTAATGYTWPETPAPADEDPPPYSDLPPVDDVTGRLYTAAVQDLRGRHDAEKVRVAQVLEQQEAWVNDHDTQRQRAWEEATRLGIPITDIRGTGPGGMVTLHDIDLHRLHMTRQPGAGVVGR